MRNKFIFLTKQSLTKKVKTKWFLFANILILLSMLVLSNLPTIITFFGGEFNKEVEVVLLQNDFVTKKDFEDAIKQSVEVFKLDSKYKVIEQSKKSDLEIEEDDTKLIVELVSDENNYFYVNLTSYEKLDLLEEQLFNTAFFNIKYNYALKNSNIDFDELALLQAPVVVKNNILSEDKSLEEKADLFEIILPILILPIFILTIFIIQMIGAEINEEKTSRSMEIIISNVSAKTHFYSKILAANLFAFIQGGLLLLYGIISMIVSKIVSNTTIIDQVKPLIEGFEFSSNLIFVIILILFMSMLSILSYSLISGILASMTVNMEDYQQIQTPIMIIMMAGYYLSIFSFLFKGSIFIKVVSYIPLLSSLLSPTLYLLGQVSIIDVLISNVLLILFNVALIKYGIKIYKIGILNYSTDKMWKRIFKAAKEK